MPILQLSQEDSKLVVRPPFYSTKGGFCDLYRGRFLPTGQILALKRPRLGTDDGDEQTETVLRVRPLVSYSLVLDV